MRRGWLGALAVSAGVAMLAGACSRAQPPAGDATQLHTYATSSGPGFSVGVSPYGTVDPASSYTPDTWTCAGASLSSCAPGTWTSWTAPSPSSPPQTSVTPRRQAPTTGPTDAPITNPTIPPPPPPDTTTTPPPPITAAPTPTTPTTRPPRAGKKH